MPQVILALNDKFTIDNNNIGNNNLELNNLKFHKCIDLNKFETERSIEFYPPDGTIELMSYRLSLKVKIIIQILAETNNLG